jgi:hypothetical protein
MLSLVIQGDLLARPCICGVFVGSVQRWLVCWSGSTLAGIRRSEAGRSHRSPIPNQRRRTCSWISAYSLRFLSMIRSSRFALAVVSGLRTGNNLQKPVLPSCRSSSSSTYLRITGSSACLPIPTRTAVYPPIHFQPACMPLFFLLVVVGGQRLDWSRRRLDQHCPKVYPHLIPHRAFNLQQQKRVATFQERIQIPPHSDH